MKFHCDRCKTRYSIADERVRGKILKIRCKNCSAVITVREDMGAVPVAAKPSRSRPVTADEPLARTLAGAPRGNADRKLKGAGAPSAKGRSQQTADPFAAQTVETSSSSLASAMQKAAAKQPVASPPARPAASPPARPAAPPPPPPPPVEPPPPDTLEEEWYVSVDGSQVGPFTLKEAKDWIGERGADDELHCWNENFDDWLPIEKVSHFRGLRGASSPAPAKVKNDHTEENQRAPSYAQPDVFDMAAGASDPHRPFDNLQSLRDEHQASVSANRAGEPPTLGGDDGLDLDIGEASRIVKLPMLMRGMGAAGVAGKVDDEADDDDDLPLLSKPASTGAVLPGVARIGSGTGPVLARAQTDAPVLAPLSDSAMASASPDILHSSPGNAKRSWLIIAVLAALVPGLIIFFVITRDGGGDEDDTARTRTNYGDLGSGGQGNDPNSRFDIRTKAGPDAGRKRTNNRWPKNGNGSVKKKRPDAGVTVAGDPSARPLGPADVTRAARRGNRSTSRCYMRAQRKDFNISQIKRIRFFIKVDKSGSVTTVTPREHTDTYLARCVRASIRKWKFRKSPKGIATETAIVFAQ